MRVMAVVLVVSCVFVAAAHAFVPSDPDGNHPAYSLLNLPQAWETSTGSPDVVIAVVDSGVDASHADLAGAVLPGYDFVDRDTDPSEAPGGGHGTAVSGVAAARAGNGIGGVGACFSCRVLPLRVLGRDGIAFNTNTAAAIDYAVDHGAAVVNISLYGEHSPPRLREAVTRARAAGVLVVAAAGNEAGSTPEYPAAFREAISVAAATPAGTLASFSSRGSWVKLAASDCAPVTVLGGGTLVGCGTSVSAPLVAGVVALLRTSAPFASADDLERALAQTARPVPGTQASSTRRPPCKQSALLSPGCCRRSWATQSQERDSRPSRGSGRAQASGLPSGGSGAPAIRAPRSPARPVRATRRPQPTRLTSCA